MRWALMWVTKRGTRTLLGNRWVDDYHVDTMCVEDSEEEARRRSHEVTAGLWWVAPFDENRFFIPADVQQRIKHQRLHVI